MATIIVAHKAGRLGNRLILFGHLIAFAEEYGVTICNPAFEEYSEIFAGTAGHAISQYPQGGGQRLWPRPWSRAGLFRGVNLVGRALRRMQFTNAPWSVLSAGHDPEFHGDVDLDDHHIRTRLLKCQVTFLFGFRFRCYGLLAKHEEVVRKFFCPSNAIAASVGAAISRLRENVDFLIGVHIRQSDYKDFHGGKLFLDQGYYATVARIFSRLLPGKKIRFVICSDEPVDLSHFVGLDVIPGPGDIAQDFFVLGRCDYLIATESTFSRWTSFLGRVPLLTVTGSEIELTDVRDLRPADH